MEEVGSVFAAGNIFCYKMRSIFWYTLWEQEMVDPINRTLMFTVYFDVHQLIDNLENVVRLGLYKKTAQISRNVR